MGSTGCLVSLVTRVTGEKLEAWDHQVQPERTEKGETMGRLDPEDCQVNPDPVGCWDPRAPLGSQDPLACEETMVLMDQREIWVLKVSRDPLDSKVLQELRECQDLKEQPAHQGRRDPRGSQVSQECQEPTALQVTQEKRVQQEPKEIRVPVGLRALSAIPDLVGLREPKVFVV